MTEFKTPRTEIEWSRRAIIDVVDVLAVHDESLTLVGAHAVLLLPPAHSRLAVGDLGRLKAVADPSETGGVIEEFVVHPEVGADVRQSVEWTTDLLRDPVSAERAKSAFDTFSYALYLSSRSAQIRGARRG